MEFPTHTTQFMGGYRGVATQHVLAPNQKIISPPPSFNVGTLVVATQEVMISRRLGFIGYKIAMKS